MRPEDWARPFGRDVMRQTLTNSVDFILTDPPYLVNYHDRNGRVIRNDADANWLICSEA